MSAKLERLETAMRAALPPEAIGEILHHNGELTVVIDAKHYVSAMRTLRDEAALRFEQLVDLSGIDYSGYANGAVKKPQRYAAVAHLLSLAHNWRLRVRVYAPEDNFPVVPSVVDIWPAANWFEREAFDMFGIAFDGHPDLRRLLTDYGFVGHPLRKDFPVSGYMEMRYDEEMGRVCYQPVTIEPRENSPRIVREATYGEGGHV